MNAEVQLTQISDRLIEFGTMYGTKVIGAIIILIVGRILAGWLTKIVRKLLTHAKVDETLTRFVANITRITLMVFVIVAALSTIGIQTASLIAVIGAAGLAIGFALQGSLSNFASGVILIIFRPLQRGDLVETGGHLGTVKEISIFNTIMKTLDNKRVIIPNSQVTGGSIVNYTAEGMLRVDMVFGISYSDNIDKAKGIIERVLTDHSLILKDPPYKVAVSELGNSSVNFVARPYVNPGDYWTVYFEVTEQVKKEFDAQGITIPFPQRDVHMFQKTA